jgi:hypothetical protein
VTTYSRFSAGRRTTAIVVASLTLMAVSTASAAASPIELRSRLVTLPVERSVDRLGHYQIQTLMSSLNNTEKLRSNIEKTSVDTNSTTIGKI